MPHRQTTYWNGFALTGCFIAAAALAASWLHAQGWWGILDTQAFYFFNGLVAKNHAAQIIWAAGSSRVFDVLAGASLVGIFFLYMREDKGRLMERFCLGLFMAVYIIGVVQIAKATATPRESPSLLLTPFYDLQHLVPWAHAKISDKDTFPSDHAIVLFMVSAFIWHFAGWRRGIAAMAIAAFACLPRLIAGAHWLSDMAAGGLIVVLIATPAALATPLTGIAVNRLGRIMSRFPRLKRLVETVAMV